MLSILRRPGLCARTGKSMSSNYRDIDDGLLTKPLPIGDRAVGWPDYEIEAINQARLWGKSDEEIKKLVSWLMEARAMAASQRDIGLDKLLARSVPREASAQHGGETTTS